jgi:hypothetical protein
LDVLARVRPPCIAGEER